MEGLADGGEAVPGLAASLSQSPADGTRDDAAEVLAEKTDAIAGGEDGGADPLLAAGDSFVAVAPETHAGAAAGVVGGGESADSEKQAPVALPDPASLTSEAKDRIIRDAYGTTPFPGVAWIMQATGLGKSAVKMRALRMELSDPSRQIAAATAVLDKVNEARRAGT